MWKEAVHAIVGPAIHAWVRGTIRFDGELATPVGLPIAHGSGPDPDRVLILGSSVVAGVGITSFDLSFAGHLARKLAARTGRGADVQTLAIDKIDVDKAAEVLGSADLARFDAILILGGVAEILSLVPLERYRRNLDALFVAVAQNPSLSCPVLIAGVAPFLQDLDVPRFTVSWLDNRIVRQNDVTRAACETTRVAQYVHFAPERTGIRLGRNSSAVYESWATALMPAVDRALAAAAPSPPIPIDEKARQRALDELNVRETPEAAVDRIVEMARDMLGADAASLNFIDRDRQWSKATAGHDGAEIPRDEAICNTTIQTPGIYVVEDLDTDPAYRDAPWREGDDHVRFYAGYPLEAPGGERVGALCVMNRTPRRFTSDETATLRDLALRAQAVLWEKTG